MSCCGLWVGFMDCLGVVGGMVVEVRPGRERKADLELSKERTYCGDTAALVSSLAWLWGRKRHGRCDRCVCGFRSNVTDTHIHLY